MTRRGGAGVAGVAAALLLAACGSDDGGGASGAASAAGSAAESAAPERETVTVLAAASLTDVFTELEPVFEEANPTADVKFSFGGSSDLAQQIVNGAPADVFASANTRQMTVVSDAGLVDGEPSLFATNVLTIAVPPGNPAGITSFADLARPEVTEVVCAPQVPCGAATDAVEQATGVALSPASEEPDVRAVLAKVSAGEADAGLVYVTDARSAAGDVEQIDFPEAQEAVNSYPIAALSEAPQPESAAAFVEFVLGPEAQRALEEAGFGTP